MGKQRALILYYSFTQQTEKVSQTIKEALCEEGWDCDMKPIRFVDEHYKITMPFRPFWPRLFRWFLPQVLGKTGKIEVPPEVFEETYDLVLFGSPTWWLYPAMPMTSFLCSPMAEKLLKNKAFGAFVVCRKVWSFNLRRVKKLGKKAGGNFVNGDYFQFPGSHAQSALTFINHMQENPEREKYYGLKIHSYGIHPEALERAKQFARETASLVKPGKE